MTRKKPHQPKVAPDIATQATAAPKKRNQHFPNPVKLGKRFPYLLTFLFLWIFCTFTYGDVFTRTVQESFVAQDTELMKHLTDQEYGQLYIFGRYLLLMFHNKWIGGLLFSLLLTIGVRSLDYALRIPQWLRGLSALIPFGLLFYQVGEGINLYYKNEPSLFMLQGIGFVMLSALLALISKIFISRFVPNESTATPTGWHKWPLGALLVILSFIPLQWYAKQAGENTILTARMQNRILDNDILPLIEDGLSAKQPTRAVAAYYAIGLVQTDQLLDHIFDISFHFPEVKLHNNIGSGEFGIFNADCNFFAGLVNSSYRCAMDQIVMNGHRLYYLKRMALCAILNQEKELAYKYLDIISKVPFENDFVETYRPMADDPELMAQHPVFRKVLELRPTEQRFEQNYREPAFLGYNVGLMEGNNAALAPSIAACLYSKDLPNMALRAAQYKQMTGAVPLAVLEGLSIHARKHPEIFQYFPELNPEGNALLNPAINNVNNFYLSIQEHFRQQYNNAPDWRERMSKDLKTGISEELRELISADWKGHYVYYYYCENIVTKDQEKKSKESSVN